MKKTGFILYLTLITLSIISGIFSLFLQVLKNTLEIDNLHIKQEIMSNDLHNAYLTTIFELSLIDKYIIEKKIANKEHYISNYSDEIKLWYSPLTRSKKSIGGFRIHKISPNLTSLNISGRYLFSFEFIKVIELKNEKNAIFFKTSIYTEPINIYCSFNKEEQTLYCEDTNSIIYKFNILGEVISVDKKNY